MGESTRSPENFFSNDNHCCHQRNPLQTLVPYENLALVGNFTKSGRTPVHEVTEGIYTMLDAGVLVICK